MKLAIAMAVLTMLALTACQSQEIESDKIGVFEASATISFIGPGARLIELEKGEFDVYAVAARVGENADDVWEMQVKIKPIGGLWTELISAKTEGEEEVLVATGDLKIDESGLYILHGDTNNTLWWTVDIFRR